MHYSVDDFTGPLTFAQRDALNAVLEPQEKILWATRPRAVFWTPEQPRRLFVMLFTALFCAILLAVAVSVLSREPGISLWTARHTGAPVSPALSALMWGILFLAVLAMGSVFIIQLLSFLSQRRRLRHTLYVVTNKRALCLSPGLIRGWNQQSFALHEGMVLQRREGRAGGELIFEWEQHSSRGWRYLRDCEEAEQRLEAAARVLRA